MTDTPAPQLVAPNDGRWSLERLASASAADVLELFAQLLWRVARGGTQWDALNDARAEVARRLSSSNAGAAPPLTVERLTELLEELYARNEDDSTWEEAAWLLPRLGGVVLPREADTAPDQRLAALRGLVDEVETFTLKHGYEGEFEYQESPLSVARAALRGPLRPEGT